MENSNNTGKIIGALLAGVAIGGVLGILFAPDKGSETRKKILAKGEDLKDLVQEKITGLMSQMNQEQLTEKEKTN